MFYFFGVWDERKGHGFHASDGQTVYEAGPFGDWVDGYFPPHTCSDSYGHDRDKLHPYQDDTIASLAHYRGWSILAMWDRSMDTRYACNAAFMIEGEFTTSYMWELALQHFPKIVSRLKAWPDR